jgi:hypothetical protein
MNESSTGSPGLRAIQRGDVYSARDLEGMGFSYTTNFGFTGCVYIRDHEMIIADPVGGDRSTLRVDSVFRVNGFFGSCP